MHRDYYLRFTDEAEAKSVLLRPDGNHEAPRFRNIDIIGLIHRPTGTMLMGESGPVPEMALLPGWHVNVRLMDDEDGSALEPFAVQPAAPRRIWG